MTDMPNGPEGLVSAPAFRPLADILDLEELDADLFRGTTPDTELQGVFGGQVAGQALVAAGRTVEIDRQVHSLHAYFLVPGDPALPLIFEVDRIRDGGSFTTRRVVAKQRGRPIFHLSASFQAREDGLVHQLPMPRTVGPDGLATTDPGDAGRHPFIRGIAERAGIDLRYADVGGGAEGLVPGRQRAWFRATERLDDDPLLHVCALAYASDLTLLSTALAPHDAHPADLWMASLDHAMWFHEPFRADTWLLYEQTSPRAAGGRGLAAGHIYTLEGTLVASVVQEGLLRPRDRGTGVTAAEQEATHG